MIRRVGGLCAALAAAVLLCAGCSSAASNGAGGSAELNAQHGTSPYEGFSPDPAQPRPSFVLTDTQGKTFSFGTQTAGHPTFLFFGYTRCTDDCPETMADVASALRHEPRALAEKTDVVFASTDVKYDTGPRIAAWLGRFSPGTHATWIGLRGTQAGIDAAQAASHITLATDGGETHSNELLLFSPDNYAHVYFVLSNQEQKQITHDLPIAAEQTGTS